MIPIRCFTCGKPIAHLWCLYQEKLQELRGANPHLNFSDLPTVQSMLENNDIIPEGKVLDELKIQRYCCRARFLSCNDKTDLI